MIERKDWVPTQTDRAIHDDIKLRARHMRKNPTMAEKLLWNRLRNKQVKGRRFRRQHPVDRFIVDFYCRDAGLVIEVDGSVHDSPESSEYDAGRQELLEQRGLTVLLFSNSQVIHETDSVLYAIANCLSNCESTRI